MEGSYVYNISCKFHHLCIQVTALSNWLGELYLKKGQYLTRCFERAAWYWIPSYSRSQPSVVLVIPNPERSEILRFSPWTQRKEYGEFQIVSEANFYLRSTAEEHLKSRWITIVLETRKKHVVHVIIVLIIWRQIALRFQAVRSQVDNA